MTGPDLHGEAEALLHACRAAGWRLATAESCTGGLVAATLTAVAGSSDVVDRGFVTYSNEAKADMLGVPAGLIHEHGAVSADVARAMAAGALERSTAHAAVSITGVAGPGGGSAAKPVGTVWFGLAVRGAAAVAEPMHFGGDRAAVRAASVRHALHLFRRAVAAAQ